MTAVDDHDLERALDVPRVIGNVTVLPRRCRGKRVVDVVVAAFGALVFAIPMVLVAFAVKTTSRGPVLFEHERVGVDGHLFLVKKFRTMRHGTHAAVLADDAMTAAYRANDYKLPPDDPRITTVGRFLRKSSLDELPQLFNVLAGDMSIVGVRPLIEVEVAERPLEDQRIYRSMKPGMTGLWQVEGRSTVKEADRLMLDRDYLSNWSLRRDLVIMARTPFAVLRTHHTH